MCFSTKAEDNAVAGAFAKGSKVTVRTGSASGNLKPGTYTVRRANSEYVYLEEITGGWWFKRFETPVAPTKATKVIANPGAFKGAKVADILRVLDAAGETGRTARGVAKILGVNERQVPKRLTELVKSGRVSVVDETSDGRKVYAVAA
jgi:hypothetical protein